MHCPGAERIELVKDQRHNYSPAETKQLADQLEVHFTPTHGSWLHMVEIALRVLQWQCLKRRLVSRLTIAGELAS